MSFIILLFMLFFFYLLVLASISIYKDITLEYEIEVQYDDVRDFVNRINSKYKKPVLGYVHILGDGG